MKRGHKGQVWIETEIYTLIAFVIIGLVLSYARPKIECMQDRAILQQSVEMLKTIDLTILDMSGAGNQRLSTITIKKVDLKLDCVNNKIVFESKTGSDCLYSEPGKNVSNGNVIELTQKITGNNLVTLTLDYSSRYNLKFNGEKILKVISEASNPYHLLILNEGEDAGGKIILNMSL
jgi:type II secretory pathway pseudopilin PulG